MTARTRIALGISAAIVSLGVSFAQDKMSKDTMSKDGIGKESMPKDRMSKVTCPRMA